MPWLLLRAALLVGKGLWTLGRWTPLAARVGVRVGAFAIRHPYISTVGAVAATYPETTAAILGGTYRAARGIARSIPQSPTQRAAPVAPEPYRVNPYFLR